MSYKRRTGRVYRIVCLPNPDIQYVGSTFNIIRQRFYKHKEHFKEWLNGKKKNCSLFPYFETYGIENFKILLIKEYEVLSEHNRDRKHLNVFEQLWISKIKCVNVKNCIRIEWIYKYNQKEYIKIMKLK